MELLQFVGSIGGIAGVLAFLIFKAYNNTINQIREDRRFMENRLTSLLERDLETREENTKTLSELTTLIIRLNGRLQ
jgi:hypothetical protein